MNKFYITVLVFLLTWATAAAQSCLPEGIRFTTQGQVDSFAINYPGCSVVEGDVVIGDIYSSSSHNINNLTGLNGIQTIEGILRIFNNDDLHNLQGLHNLTYIGGDVSIIANGDLNNLFGLDNIDTIQGDLLITDNYSISNLLGLDSLALIEGDLTLEGNSSLNDLSGLSNLHVIGKSLIVQNNPMLKDFLKLQSLDSLGGLTINDCHKIKNFLGLSGVQNIGGSMIIYNNNSLNSFAGLAQLVSIGKDFSVSGQSLKNFVYLVNLTNIGGNFSISGDTWETFGGLYRLTSIGGNLSIIGTTVIDDFAGLNRLVSIGGTIVINGTNSLENFVGLDSIATLGGISVRDAIGFKDFTGLASITTLTSSLAVQNNPSLQSFNGLTNLKSIEGSLWVYNNPLLINFAGLTNVNTIGTNIHIENNPALTNLSGLDSLHHIMGDVQISANSNLVNLIGLHTLHSVTKGITLYDNHLLMNLIGLDNLNTIGGNLWITSNPALHSLSSLHRLKTIGGGLNLSSNNTISSLLGLDSLRSIGTGFWMESNPLLSSLSPLSQLDSIGGNLEIGFHDSLTTLAGLENLRVIGGNLSVYYNNVLSNIDSLSNVQSVGGSVLVFDNPVLQTCGIYPICNQIFNHPEFVEISGNGQGCSNPLEVELSCGAVPIFATVLLDNNSNCQSDSTDVAGEGILVRLSGPVQQILRPTQSEGVVRFGYLDTATFSLSLPHFPTQNWAVCQDSISFLTDTIQNPIHATFFLQPLNQCPQLTVDLGLPPFFRGCLVTSPMQVVTRNIGTIPAEAARVAVVMPDGLELVSAIPPVSAQSGDTLFFDLGEVVPFQASTVNMVVKTSCAAAQSGKALCLEAFATFTNPCPITTPSASEIRLFSECMSDTTVRFTIKNVGNAATQNAHDYVIIEDEVILLSQPFSLDPLASLDVDVASNGATYRMEATKYDDGTLTATAVENCGGFTPGFITAYWLNDGLRDYDFDCREIRNAYDPNQKTAIPTGVGPEHLLAANKPIQYTIDFQNTGTDTAFRVQLLDILPEQLDVNSFRPGFSSHPYIWEIRGADTLEVLFYPIMLPDSNVNEAASHGWFSFEINQKPDLPDGTTIENAAAIVFDYNPPIITNTVLHTIGKLTVSVDDPQDATQAWQIFNNPTRYAATFKAKEFMPGEKRFELSDAMGRVVRTEHFSGQEFEFRRDVLAGGLYYFRIIDARGRVFSGKIVISE